MEKQIEDAVINTWEYENVEQMRKHVEWMESRNYDPVYSYNSNGKVRVTFRKDFDMSNVV